MQVVSVRMHVRLTISVHSHYDYDEQCHTTLHRADQHATSQHLLPVAKCDNKCYPKELRHSQYIHPSALWAMVSDRPQWRDSSQSILLRCEMAPQPPFS